MLVDAITNGGVRGGRVLDPFLGSGTSLIAAERSGTICRAVESDPGLVDTAIRRWQAFTGGLAYRADGRSFNELQREAMDE
jgi:DNA modification methylase